jgi:hypothetical protein
MKQIGISPKVAAAVVSAVVGWLVTHFALDIDANAAAGIVLALLTAAGVLAPPGNVAPAERGPASDALLAEQLKQ